MEGNTTNKGLAVAVHHLLHDLNAPFWNYVESLSSDLLGDAYLVRLNRIANTRKEIKELQQELRSHLAELDCILSRMKGASNVRPRVSGNGRDDKQGLQRVRGLRPANQAAISRGRPSIRRTLGVRCLPNAA